MSDKTNTVTNTNPSSQSEEMFLKLLQSDDLIMALVVLRHNGTGAKPQNPNAAANQIPQGTTNSSQ